MKLKFIKNFFHLQSKQYAKELILIKLSKDKHPPKEYLNNIDLIYVETCPLFANSCFGMICESGYIEKNKLILLKNNKENRNKIKQYAAAKRQSVERSQMWYDIHKGNQQICSAV